MIQINGEEILAGTISGKSNNDAIFEYDEDYIKKYPAISISLPTYQKNFSAKQTRNFFEGR